MGNATAKNIFKKSFKIFGWLILSILGLVLLLIISLYLPPVGRIIGNQAASYLSGQTGTKVDIERINLLFPLGITAKEIFIEDQNNDTLLWSQNLNLRVSLLDLFQKKITVTTLNLENLSSSVYRHANDTIFNYQFIVDAFISENNDAATTNEDATTSQWDFSIVNVELKKLSLQFNDELEHQYFSLLLGYFNLDIDEFDLKNNRFVIDEILLQNTELQAKLNTALTDTDEEKKEDAPLPEITLNFLKFHNIKISYSDVATGQEIAADVGDLILSENHLDLPNQNISLQKFSLENSFISFIQNPVADEKPAGEVAEEVAGVENGNWKFFASGVRLFNNTFRYHNENKTRQTRGLDYNHLHITDFRLDARDIQYSEELISTEINQLAFREQSGFRIDSLRGNIMVAEQEARLENFKIKTGNSRIEKHLALNYPSLEKIADDLAALSFDANFQSTYIGFQDILLLQPELYTNPILAENAGKSVALDGRLSGTMAQLKIENFTAAIDNTRLFINGTAGGLAEGMTPTFNIPRLNFSTTRNDIIAFVPDTLIPKGITLPEQINLSASASGSLNDLIANTHIKTSLGDLFADFALQRDPTTQLEKYQGDVRVGNLDLGKLLKQQEMLGMFDLTASVNGSGLSPENMRAELNAVVSRMEINQYAYHDLLINGLLDRQEFIGDISIDDENLQFTFSGDVNFNEELPDINADFQLRGANLQALNFTKDDLRIQATLQADVTGNELDNLTGDVEIRDVIIVKNGETYRIDSLLFASLRDTSQTNIRIDSDFFSGFLFGSIKPSEIGPVLSSHLNKYFHFEKDTKEEKEPEYFRRQDFEFAFTFRDPIAITELFVPQLKDIQPLEIQGFYDSFNRNLAIDISLPGLIYDGTEIDSLIFKVRSDVVQMVFELHLAEIATPSFAITYPSVTGQISNDVITTRVNVKDEDMLEKFGISAQIRSMEEHYILTVLGDKLILNYANWQVPEDNFIRITENGFVVNNLVLEKNGQFLAVNTQGERETDPLELTFSNFWIGNLSTIIEDDETIVRGIIDGEIILKNLQGEQPFFTADLDISNFSFREDTLGNISIAADNLRPGVIGLDAEITGFDNQVNIKGNYFEESGEMDFRASVINLNLTSVQGFAEDHVSRLSGNLRGNLTIKGKPDNPQIRGSLDFVDAGFNLTMLNSFFTLERERISFDRIGIGFNGFQLKDSLGNTAVVNGHILTENYQDFAFDLNLSTNNFIAMNTERGDNELYYRNCNY
jgi:hypothetical protein